MVALIRLIGWHWEFLPWIPRTLRRRFAQDSAALPGSVVVDLSNSDPSHVGQNVAPGLDPETFAYAKTIVHRNLFQIPLP
jgi:hypothetical protein